MVEYQTYFPAKVESLVVGKETTVAYVEFFDGSKALVSVLEKAKVGDSVLVGRKILLINPNSTPPILWTKDEIIQVLTEENDKIYTEMKGVSDGVKKKQKEIDDRVPMGVR